MVEKKMISLLLILMIGLVSAYTPLINYDIYGSCNLGQGDYFGCAILNYELPLNVFNWFSEQPQVIQIVYADYIETTIIIFTEVADIIKHKLEAYHYKIQNIKAQTTSLPNNYRLPNDCYIDEANGGFHSVYFENDVVKFRKNDTRCYL